MSSAINSEKRKKERREERKKEREGNDTIRFRATKFFSVYVPASNLRTHPAGTSQEFENDTKINMWLASFPFPQNVAF